jgi:hypothetical protein
VAHLLASFQLPSPEHGGTKTVDVLDGIDPAHLDNIEKAWRPIIKRQRDRALLEYFQLPASQQIASNYFAILERLGVPDEHWDWRQKVAIASGTSRRPYSIVQGLDVEGVMILLNGKTSRAHPAGSQLVYVDYVATAPWNRRQIQNPERMRGVGSLLLGTAVDASRMLGWDGRCGLHSLPSAESFYRKIGMKEFGPDSNYHGLVYFEFDAFAATTFTS